MTYFIEIDSELCKGCELCIPVCPKNVIELTKNMNSRGLQYAKPVRNEDCIGCRQCVEVCPDVAIKIFRNK